MKPSWNLLVSAALLLAATSASAQRELSRIPPPDVAAELEAFTVADGFEVNLFASDPEIANPIHMNFDAEGRLWVVGSAVYPHIGVGEDANDRVTILEDTTGDGVADRHTVFAEGLFIPTGVLPGDGGAYVANSTELLHLRDTTGDGQADTTRVVLSGFGTEDTHHILHTLRWGPAGDLFMSQSIYIHSHVETPWGVKRLDGGGIWKFRPETLELSVFARGFVNTWGHAIDAWGQSFATDGAYHEGVNHVFPGAAFLAGKSPRILHGLSPGSPKHCGLEVVSSGHFPEDWQGNMITNDFRGHRVSRFVINDIEGAYNAIEMPEVLTSNHVAFRPVDVKMGLDGAMYIADWYNPIIQHGEVDFRDERRDRRHGRIWRITAKDRPLLEKPQIVGASTGELVALLQAPEELVRTYAKRELLSHRATSIHRALGQALESLEGEAADLLRLEAMWLFRARGEFRGMSRYAPGPQADPRARAAAIRLVHDWSDDPAAALTEALGDGHPRVRLEALRQAEKLAGTLEGAALAEAVLQVLDRPLDDAIDYALWLTLRNTASAWLPALEAPQWPAFAEDTTKLLFALQAIDDGRVVRPALRALERADLGEDARRHAALLAATHGDAGVAVYLVQILLPQIPSAAHRRDVLAHLADAARRRDTRPLDPAALLTPLLGENAGIAAAAFELAGAWRVEALRPEIEARIEAGDGPEAVRNALYRALTDLGGEASLAFLRTRAERDDIPDKLDTLLALARLDAAEGAGKAVDHLNTTDEGETERLVRAFLQLQDGPAMLEAALDDREVPRNAAATAQRVIRSSGQTHDALVAAFQVAGGLDAPREMPEGDALLALVETVRETGDPARGEVHFRALDCAMCHAIAGAGSSLGPDMTSIGASAQIDYLIQSILAPNDAIKEGFHSKVVRTYDFETFSGIPTGQTDTELILRDATDTEVRIPFDNIESEEDGQSLMPAGLADALLDEEFIDLIAYLSALGRKPDFSVGTARKVRTWRALQRSEEMLERLNTELEAPVTEEDALFVWGPVYSTVSGALPLEDVPILDHPWWSERYSYLRFSFEVTRGGDVAFAPAATDGLRVWLDGEPVDPAAPWTVAPGTSTVTLLVDRGEHDAPIEWVVNEAGTTAVVQLVTGR